MGQSTWRRSFSGSGYDASKVRPRWNGSTGELSLEVLSGASASDVRAALGRLQLETSRVDSASTRKVWVFPTLSLFSRPEGVLVQSF